MRNAHIFWSTRGKEYSIRTLLAVLAVALLIVPFATAWYRHLLGLQVTEQFATAPAVLTGHQRANAEAVGDDLPDRTPPVVLSYHDIRPVTPTEKYPNPLTNPGYHYVVTPEAFDAQLTALAAAGYKSLTSDQYVDYLSGGEVPDRSVLITFDDGTHGLWTYADEILERHGMHGVAFLITGNVGAKRPYYLTWQEIDRLAASGRWDFESHTRKMHARMPVNRSGELASEMVHRRWLFEFDRAETLDEFEQKIRMDLSASIDDIVAHGLPRPRLFAFPFSEGYRDPEGGDPQAAAVAAGVVKDLFACGFNNAPPQPLPAGARAATVGMVGRIELTQDSTVDELLDKLHARTPVTPAQAPPSERTDLWTLLDDSPAPVRAAGTDVTLLGEGTWEGIAYGRHATADWASYRSSVLIRGLAAAGVENAALVTRIGTGSEVSAQVSSDRMRLTVGLGANPVVVGELPLPPADVHTVGVTVSPTATDVIVDGEYALSVPSDGGTDAYGGIGLTSSRTADSAPWPVFSGLTVSEAGPAPNVIAGVGVPLRG